jgi:transcriptional regulator with XRE-family HTH domain
VSESAIVEATCGAVVRILRKERTRQGISMETLAKKAGLSKGMVSFVERELRNPTLNTVMRISRALKMDLGRVIQQASRSAKERH